MAQFRKKPVVIEAVQLRWDTWPEMLEFASVGTLAEGKPESCFIMPDDDPHAARLFGGYHSRQTWAMPRATKTAGPGYRLGLHIPTLEGVVLAVEDDWIIRGVKGELYPCKPDIFEATYQRVDARVVTPREDAIQTLRRMLKALELEVTPSVCRAISEQVERLLEAANEGSHG